MNLFNNICTRLYVFTKNDVRAFATNEKGVTAIEYAIIAVAMSTIVLAVFNSSTFSSAITGAMSKVSTSLSSATSHTVTP